MGASYDRGLASDRHWTVSGRLAEVFLARSHAHVLFIADGSSHATRAEVTSYDKTPYDPYSPNNLWSDPLVSLLTFALDEEVE